MAPKEEVAPKKKLKNTYTKNKSFVWRTFLLPKKQMPKKQIFFLYVLFNVKIHDESAVNGLRHAYM